MIDVFQSTRIPEGMRDIAQVDDRAEDIGFNPRASPKECAMSEESEREDRF